MSKLPLIVRNPATKREPLPPLSWDERLENLTAEVRNTLNAFGERIRKAENIVGNLPREIAHEVVKAMDELPKTFTDQTAAIESLKNDLQELANDFDQAQAGDGQY